MVRQYADVQHIRVAEDDAGVFPDISAVGGWGIAVKGGKVVGGEQVRTEIFVQCA